MALDGGNDCEACCRLLWRGRARAKGDEKGMEHAMGLWLDWHSQLRSEWRRAYHFEASRAVVYGGLCGLVVSLWAREEFEGAKKAWSRSPRAPRSPSGVVGLFWIAKPASQLLSAERPSKRWSNRAHHGGAELWHARRA